MKKNYSPTEANPLFHLTKAVIPLLIILFGLLVSCIEEPLEDPLSISSNQAPSISCPADIMQVVATGAVPAVVEWAELPTVTDSDEDEGALASAAVANPEPGSMFEVGATTVTYTVTDNAGATDTCTFTVTVIQDALPTLSACPTDIVATANTGANTAEVDWVVPTATDNEDDNNNNAAVTMEANYNPGDALPMGKTEVTYTARDSRGQEDACTFTVTVNANSLPTITCPADIQRVVTADVTSVLVKWGEPTVTDVEDNAAGLSLRIESTSGSSSGGGFRAGTTSVVAYTVTDSNNGTDSCEFSVAVIKAGLPTISKCPDDIIVTADTGLSTVPVSWEAPMAEDADGVSLSVVPTHLPGTAFTVGSSTEVTYTARDSHGQADACSFTVTVNENNLPTITCPADIERVVNAGVPTVSVTWNDLVVTDTEDTAESGNLNIVLTSGPAPGDLFPVGTTPVTYTVTDSNSGTKSCTFLVEVKRADSPTISQCPNGITVTADTGSSTVPVSWEAPTAANADGSFLAAVPTHPPGTAFTVGSSTEVTYMATDSRQQTVMCSFTVTVNANNLPTITCPAGIEQVISAGLTSGSVEWSDPAVADVEDDAAELPLLVEVTSGPASGDTFQTGTTSVTYTVTDSNSGTKSCTFTVTVNANNLPTIACPMNEDRNLTGTEDTTASVTWNAPVISDVEDNQAGIVLTSTGAASHAIDGDLELTSDFGGVFPIGITTVTYTVTDSHNGMKTCSFTVTVTKSAPPMFMNCPNDISRAILTNGGNTLAVTWDVPTAIDEEGSVIPAGSISSNFSPGNEFSKGQTTEVIYTATDSNSISATCSFNVIISDNYAPVFTRCPEDMVVGIVNLNDVTAVARWANPIVTDEEDNFGALTKVASYSTDGGAPSTLVFRNRQNQQISATLGLGVTTVTYSVTDTADHTATCVFMVTVTDDSPIFQNCPEDISMIVNAAEAASTSVTWNHPTASDKTDGAFTAAQIMNVASHQPGTIFQVGTTTVSYTLTDSVGYVGMCSFAVTLTLNNSPRFNNCPNDITRTLSIGSEVNFQESVGWIPPTATDAEDRNRDLQVAASHNNGFQFGLGDTVVTYTVTDSNGATGACSFVVSIRVDYPEIALVDSEDERILITEAYSLSNNTVTIVEIYIEKAPPLPSDVEVGSSSRFITLDRIGIRSPATRPGETNSYRYLYNFTYNRLGESAATTNFYEGSFYVLAFASSVDSLAEGAHLQVAWPDGSSHALPTVEGDCVAIELVLLNDANVYETQDFLQAGNGCDLGQRGLSWDASSGTLSTPVSGQSLARSIRPSDEEAGFEQSLGTFHANEWETTTTHTPGYPLDASCISGGNTADVDEDGIPDCLEVSGGTYFGMSFYDWGARMSQKDIFVEVDYMPCSVTGDLRSQPDKEAFERIRDQFNTYSQSGTNLVLHLDVGDLFGDRINDGFNLGGGNSIITNAAERSNYWGITLTRSEEEGARRFHQTKQDNFSPVRKHFFHYMVFAETDGTSGEEGDTLGIAELGGNDSLMTMGGGGTAALERVGLNLYPNCNIDSATESSELANVAKNYFQNNQAYTVMHELGHNLGLRHGGGRTDGKNYEPNYFSVMNYLYAVHGPPDRASQDETRKRVRDAYYYRHRTSEANTNCLRRFDDELDNLPTRGSNFTGINNGQRIYGEDQELHLFYRDLDDFDLHFSTGGNSNLNENSVDERNLFNISRGGGTWSMPLDIDCDGTTNTALGADVNFDGTNSNNLNDHDDVNNISSFFASPFGNTAAQSFTSARVRSVASAGKEPKLQARMRRQRKPFNDIQPVVSAEEERRPDMLKVDLSSSATLDQNRHDHDHDHDHGHGHK